jgi:hypothetical protein
MRSPFWFRTWNLFGSCFLVLFQRTPLHPFRLVGKFWELGRPETNKSKDINYIEGSRFNFRLEIYLDLVSWFLVLLRKDSFGVIKSSGIIHWEPNKSKIINYSQGPLFWFNVWNLFGSWFLVLGSCPKDFFGVIRSSGSSSGNQINRKSQIIVRVPRFDLMFEIYLDLVSWFLWFCSLMPDTQRNKPPSGAF